MEMRGLRPTLSTQATEVSQRCERLPSGSLAACREEPLRSADSARHGWGPRVTNRQQQMASKRPWKALPRGKRGNGWNRVDVILYPLG